MNKAYLSIGSNIGDRLANLQKAVQLLADSSQIELLAVSSAYETEPVGGVKQDSFYNIAVKIRTDLTAPKLLDFLHWIEQSLHRKRLIHWGPRTIDLDIIDFNHQQIKTPTLIIPHSEMANRRFVLVPMLEISTLDEPYRQRLTALLKATSDHNWLKKIYGQEVFLWTSKK